MKANAYLFCMLNPSQASAETDDHTSRKLIGFTTRWWGAATELKHRKRELAGERNRELLGRTIWTGAREVEVLVVNLFTFRATDPKELLSAPAHELGTSLSDDAFLLRFKRDVLGRGGIVIAAWGHGGPAAKMVPGRARTVLGLLRPDVYCFGLTGSGQPKHPLTLPYSTRLVRLP